jgi:pimeloyl-ACP methyl ester carboxylesterase
MVGMGRYSFWKTETGQNDSKSRHSLSPTLCYSHKFATPITINPIEKIKKRRQRGWLDSPKANIGKRDQIEQQQRNKAERSTVQQTPEHDPGTLPPLSSLQPLVDSVTLRLVRLVTGGKSKFIDTELTIGEGSNLQRVSTPVHILDIPGNGDLPPVVLLHGITSCSADFAPLAYQLRSKFSRVIAIDLLGHGLTPLPNARNTKPHFSWMTRVVSQVLDKCLPESGDEKAILLGNSMGGLVAMRTALARPDLVDGLFLISPAGGPLSEKEISGLSNIFHISSHEEGTTFIDRMHGKAPANPLRHLMAWVARGRVNSESVKVRVIKERTLFALVVWCC